MSSSVLGREPPSIRRAQPTAPPGSLSESGSRDRHRAAPAGNARPQSASEPAIPAPSSLGDRMYWLVVIACVVFIGFVGGAYVVLEGVFPSQWLRDAHKAGHALKSQRTDYSNVYLTDLWNPARTEARGVTIHAPSRAQAGLTLYTSGHAPVARLINMDGALVHEWRRPYSAVWDETAVVKRPVPDEQTYIRSAKVLPNGDLLAIYVGVGDTPWGYGMVRLDADSNVVWKYLAQTHHNFTVAPDGRIFALTHEISKQLPQGVDHLDNPWIEDFLVVLSPEGRELQKISLPDALVRSPFRRMLSSLPSFSLADPLHTNDVDLIDARQAALFPFAKEGQVLLSFRDLSGGVIAVLDIPSRTIVWAQRGPWISQHDPDLLDNGNVLLFDNTGSFGPGGMSRVIEFNPVSGEIRWSYTGDESAPLDSDIRSGQERLANGNTLITESVGGRILEVTPDGDRVWEFVNPVRGRNGEQDYIPVVSWAQRIAPESLHGSFRTRLRPRTED
jgi:hypothetical protein